VRSGVSRVKAGLCAGVQLNRGNFDVSLKSSLTPFFHWALQLRHVVNLANIKRRYKINWKV